MCGRARDFNGTRTRPDKHETVRCGETDTLTHTNCCKFKGDELEQRENIEVASVQAEFRDDNGCASLQVTQTVFSSKLLYYTRVNIFYTTFLTLALHAI